MHGIIIVCSSTILFHTCRWCHIILCYYISLTKGIDVASLGWYGTGLDEDACVHGIIIVCSQTICSYPFPQLLMMSHQLLFVQIFNNRRWCCVTGLVWDRLRWGCMCAWYNHCMQLNYPVPYLLMMSYHLVLLHISNKRHWCCITGLVWNRLRWGCMWAWYNHCMQPNSMFLSCSILSDDVTSSPICTDL